MTRFALASLLALLLAGCGTAAGLTARPTAAPQQWSGPHSGVAEPSTRVVRDPAAWTALWQQLDREAPPAPAWSTRMAVAVFLGQRRSAGFRLEVLATREECGQLVITVREQQPAPGKIVAQVLTSPWAVAVVPASPLPVVARVRPGDPPVTSAER
ncbi:protease complex subunit PrcB family protein [Opitutus terrae]|uniref:PrcB C-terminal domain-containing protein n=1 Tax=Opitutus terrae (strain DSM 11246 / JCM 15787 / PB90-1) TaxID=452637 RepID=B1ZNI3_OPITP|nr:protease complex subunit PrcB family protein [Opitutus terrae]ACB74417.1 conserved hypothetical protein [Opitutus terrae PB90-1]